MKAVVANAWFSAPAAAAVSFSPTPVSVIVPSSTEDCSAARSRLRIGTRVPPTSAVSCGVAPISMMKSVSSTRVEPRLSAIPPLWAIVPAKVLASTRPPVIGNASESEPIGAAAIPRLCSAEAAPASRVTVVAPPVSPTLRGLARSETVPSLSPRANRSVEKVALSALAAAPVSATRTPVKRVSRPAGG